MKKNINIFPNNFNLTLYKLNNLDLENFNENELLNNYINHGISEGRTCNEINSRNDLSLLIPNDYNCLEIGPFDCPVLKGNNIKYFDVLNQQQLIERAKKINRIQNINNIPYIHYYDNQANLKIINEQFNLILSCHCIEHQVNFIKHLNDVNNLLLSNGYYVIICPDKRYCFDHYIKESTIADILNMDTNSTRHSLKSVIEHRVLVTHNDPIRHWNNDHGIQRLNDPKFDYMLLFAINEYNNEKEYIDVHSLQFTPQSFEQIINILEKNNLINFYIDKVYPTKKYSNEFIVIIRKKN
jgi:hypothetical protein